MRIRDRAVPARAIAAAIAAVTALALPTLALGEVPFDTNTFGGLSARSIGPAVMSGRIAAIDAVASDPVTLWVGAASGGVWKSTDAGTTWEPVFDDHVQSIGAIEVDPQNPDVVWVGTGETWVRNSVSVGAGLFKTTDGGQNWKLMGLEASERIAKVAVDPTASDTVFVCATGPLWSAGGERGVYKTTDGGETWEKVLEVDADTGCADLDLDPQDPEIVYAAMWQFRRSPDFFVSGGPGSGLYKSTDGGETWKRLEKGLPEGELGRIAVAVAPTRPNRVYATVEAEDNALYRSDDLGESWTEVNSSNNVQMRPFYFSELAVDPKDFDRVYKPAFSLTVSVDGGESFTGMFGGGFGMSVHPDHHAIWIHPERTNEIYIGTDGGLYVSYDRGDKWNYVNRLPLSQFYRVSHDLEIPYNVYGGLQDNGSWTGPSRGTGGSVRNRHWDNIGYGDGFWAFPDPRDANTVYVEYQGGNLMRHNRELGTLKDIKPYADSGEEELRFNWNAPIHLSPNDEGTIYFGSQYLHRSRDRGDSWERISPDLTTDDPEKQRQAESGGLTLDNSTAENHTTIYAIAESPVDGEVIWVGTDDGNLQVTRDGGETWTNVAPEVEGVPAGTWVSWVEPGRFDAATAFATFDGHRTGDMATHVYKTADGGETWRSLGAEALEGYAHVIRQDPVTPELLYLGTEFGLFLSLDGGGHWARFEENLPKVSVRAISIHPREHDVILGTHGRGVYILDDVTPLRHLTPEALSSKVALLPTRPAVMVATGTIQDFSSDDEFRGENPPEAATIAYYLARRHLFGDFKIEVYGDDGELITTLPTEKRKGINRVAWPMRLKPPRLPPATSLVPGFIGPRVPEGTYRIRMIKGDEVLEGEVELVADPRSPYSKEDRELQQKTALELYHRVEDLTFLVENLTHLRDGARERATELEGSRAKKLEAFADRLEEMRKTLVSSSDRGMLAGEDKLRERMAELYGRVSSYDGRPSQSQLDRLEILLGEMDEAEEAFESLLASELEAANQILDRAGLEKLEPLDREEWEGEEGSAGGGSALPLSKKQFKRFSPFLLAAPLAAF